MFYKKNRSLSPHLYVYKPQVTSLISIFHRVSGSVMSVILLYVSFYVDFVNFMLLYHSSFFIYYLLNLIFYVFFSIVLITFVFHFTNGIRHLIWDTCVGLDLNNIFVTACFVLIITFFLTFLMLLF